MNFKKYDRVEYERNSLFEVVFQARFPQIIKISNEEPTDFQDTIRKIGYPEYKENSPNLPTEIPDEIRKAIAKEKVYSFLSECGNWNVSLSKDFIALTCNHNYKDYAEFRAKLVEVMNVFHKIYSPNYFTRIGFRYKNLINKSIMGEGLDLKADIPKHIAPEFQEGIKDNLTTFEKVAQYTDEDSHKINVRHVYGTLSGIFGAYQINDEESYIVDIDCFSEKKIHEVNDAFILSDSFNKNVRNIFRWSIGETIHGVMEPKP